MRHYNHVDMMKDFIEERLERGVNTFTHKDILNATNANCSYSVLKCLKKYYDITYKNVEKEKIKKTIKNEEVLIKIKFREYTILKRKDKETINAKSSNIWRGSKNNNNQTLFLGKTIS